MNILTILSRLGEAIEDTTGGTTNYGGCAVVAAIVGEKLLARGYDVRVRVFNRAYMGRCGRDLCEVAEEMEWNADAHRAGEWPCSFGHVALSIEVGGCWWVWDSENLIAEDDLDSYADDVSRWVAEEGWIAVYQCRALADVKQWNPRFNRELIPKIEQAVAMTLAVPQVAAA